MGHWTDCASLSESSLSKLSEATFSPGEAYIEGWSQDCSKSDGCFSQYLISSPPRRYEDYNIFFCEQWKFRCHCSYEQWHLNLHCLQRGQSCPYTRVSKICCYYSLALNPRIILCSTYAFVTVSSIEQAQLAILQHDQALMKGRRLTVGMATLAPNSKKMKARQADPIARITCTVGGEFWEIWAWYWGEKTYSVNVLNFKHLISYSFCLNLAFYAFFFF